MFRFNWRYFLGFLLLTGVEVFIALFVHDQLVRPFIGDMLVVMVLYLLIRSLVPRKTRWLPAGIFVFAVMVELSQLINIGHYLGWENNRFMQILCGSVFDVKDIACYGTGCLVLFVIEGLQAGKAH